MTEKVEDQSFGESLESEGTEDEVSSSGNSKIKYTRTLLLGLKVWRKLPRDFDVLILRELNGESDGAIEKKSISGNSSGHDSFPRTTWNLSLPGERWDNHSLILDKESHLQKICSLEGRNVACQQLSLEDSYGAGVLGQNPPKRDLSRLSKSENPYLPPHCNKKRMQPSADISETRKESSLGSDQKTSADSITGNDKNGYDTPLVGVDYSTNKPLGECEDSTEGNELFVANETIKEIIEEVLEDNQITFDDLWTETLEIIHRFQQESSVSPTNSCANFPDTELEIRFRKLKNLGSGDDKANSEDEVSTTTPKKLMHTLNTEAEINLPDEDSLISICDLIAPESLMAMSNSDSSKATSNNIRIKSESPFQFPGLMMTQGQLHPHIFGPEKTSCLNFHPMLMIPNIAPCYMTSYSVLEQPYTLPHLVVDASRLNRPTKAEWNEHEFSFWPLPSQQVQATSYQGFGSSNAAGGFGNKKASSSFSLWHTQF